MRANKADGGGVQKKTNGHTSFVPSAATEAGFDGLDSHIPKRNHKRHDKKVFSFVVMCRFKKSVDTVRRNF